MHLLAPQNQMDAPGYCQPSALTAFRASTVQDIDVLVLVYLLGEVVSPLDPIDGKRRLLMDGLCEWIGGYGWVREIHRDNRLTSRTQGPRPAADGPVEPVRKSRREDSADHKGFSLVARRKVENGVEVMLALFRKPGSAAFTRRESTLVALVFDEVGWLYDDPCEPRRQVATALLSPRQQTIVQHLCRGWDRKHIAGELGISANTLAWHLKEIYRRLGVRNQAALLRAAVLTDGPGPTSS